MFIETEITLLPTGGIDMVSAYQESVRQFGKQNTYLLESLGGPAQDSRQSILGMNCLASIDITAERIRVDATSALLPCISRAIDEALSEPRMLDGGADIQSNDEIWRVLRGLNSLFTTSKDLQGFHFGYLGCFAYDFARVVERLPECLAREGVPLVTLGLFQSYLMLNADGGARLVTNRGNLFPVPPTASYQAIADAALRPVQSLEEEPIPDATVVPTMEKSRFMHSAQVALRHIRMGDIYQVQIGHEVRVRTPMAPLSLYRRLRRFNPSPYMFLCHVAGHDLIGSSPENYILLESGQVSMRPIAGTAAKSGTGDRRVLADALISSRKENAEHIMLVDLCRNDLARICQTGTLGVPSLMAVEEFSELFHLVSTVSARIAPGQDVFDVIRATFPAGTMTGAPKIRAMEIIESLEISPRGIYAGAIGLLGPNNYANMALCIRMASHQDQLYRLRACAGIVADSDPEKEWRETVDKMNAVFKSLTGRKLDL
jgi:anthranilate synthase component I